MKAASVRADYLAFEAINACVSILETAEELKRDSLNARKLEGEEFSKIVRHLIVEEAGLEYLHGLTLIEPLVASQHLKS